MEQKRKPFQDYLHDETLFMADFVERNLSRSVEMFTYGGMPEEIPILVYERSLQKSGWLCVFQFEKKMYALPCAIEGELDAYFMPKKVRVVNPYLDIKNGGFDRTFEIGVDCAIVKNDTSTLGLLPLYVKYGTMARTAELTLDTLTFLSRIPFLITAKDLNNKEGAKAFLDKVKNGDYGVIAGNDFFESVKTDITPKGERQIADVVEMANYVQSRLFNEIGILADYNGMKKERTGGADTAFATPSLIPFVENMLNERKQGWERVNALFGTSVAVEFNSVWQLNIEMMKKNTELNTAERVTEAVDKIETKGEIENDVAKENDGEAEVEAGSNDGGATAETNSAGSDDGGAKAETDGAEREREVKENE